MTFQTEASFRSRRAPAATLLLAACAFTFTLAGCGASAKNEAAAAAAATAAAKSAAEPMAIRVASAETKTVARSIDITGALVADDSVNISSEVQGRIASINYDFGQTVKKGAVIAQIDKQEFQIQHDRAKAALAQALARVGLNPDQEDQVASTTPLIRQARAQLEDARSKLESAKKLFESGDIARERFTELEKLVNARTANLDAAMDDLRTSMATVQTLRADKRLIEKRLNDTTIRAPFDGQISQRMVAPGQYIKDNVPIVTLVKTWPLRLRADIPEVAVAAVRTGETLSFTTESILGRTFTATVTQLNPSLEARSRSLTAEARLNQADPQLRPGMFVQVRLVVGKNLEITVVPRQAVYTIAGLTKLFAVEGSNVREIRFTPGQAEGDWLEVPGGLIQPGATVAVDKLPLLSDGVPVRIDSSARPKGD